MASEEFPSARVIVIDPHSEYSTALGDKAHVFRISPNEVLGEKPLRVPFWALPFDELQPMTLGGLQPNHEAAIREQVLDLKTEAAKLLKTPPPPETLTADLPVPFSINRLWYELDQLERKTFKTTGTNQKEEDAYPAEKVGNPETLTSDRFPIASPYNQAPYKNQRKRNIERQLDMMRTRLRDGRFRFLFKPGGGYAPSLDGKITSDLDDLVRDWVGHDRQVTVFDVSGLPSDILSAIVGTMLRIVYDMLFWGQELPVGGRRQPLRKWLTLWLALCLRIRNLHLYSCLFAATARSLKINVSVQGLHTLCWKFPACTIRSSNVFQLMASSICRRLPAT